MEHSGHAVTADDGRHGFCPRCGWRLLPHNLGMGLADLGGFRAVGLEKLTRYSRVHNPCYSFGRMRKVPTEMAVDSARRILCGNT